MNRIFLVAIFATMVPFHLIGAEPSAFGAGNLNNPKPYGLTSSEKVILQNKTSLKSIRVKSNNQANEVDSIRERIDGFQTVIESLSRKSQENRLRIRKLDEKNSEDLNSSQEYEKRLGEISQANSQDIEQIKSAIDELSTLVDTIESAYVSKDEFNALVGDFNKFKGLVAKELNVGTKSKNSKLGGMSNAQIAKLARKNYDRKYYTKSIEQYSHLIEKNYKPARAHYMIGEIYYYRKNYSDAIAYFKKSASMYSKASYMSILMLHTAVSMEKTGDIKNAKSFYKGIVSKYPDSKYASTAKKNLNKMK